MMWLVAPDDISSNFREQNIPKDTKGGNVHKVRKN